MRTPTRAWPRRCRALLLLGLLWGTLSPAGPAGAAPLPSAAPPHARAAALPAAPRVIGGAPTAPALGTATQVLPAEPLSAPLASRAAMTATAPSDTTVSVALGIGWHLISYAVQPPSTRVQDVLASLGTSYDIVYGFDPSHGGAQSYFTDPAMANFDTLTDLLPLHGYWLHLQAAGTLTLTGAPLDAASALTLTPGWNLVGYAGAITTPRGTALGGLGTAYDIIYGFEGSLGGALSWFRDPQLAQFDTLTTLVPGEGYWVHLTGTTPLPWTAGLPPAPTIGQLQVTITDLPTNTPASVTVTGPSPATTAASVTTSQTLTLAAGQYTITAQPVEVATDTYHPTVTPATVLVPAGGAVQAGVDYLTIIPSTTQVLGSTAASALTAPVSTSSGTSTLVFSNTAALPSLVPGDVVVAGVSPQTPAGFLGKVTAMSVQGTQTVVTTGPATLFDAVPRGGFDLQTTLSATNVRGAPAPAATRSATGSAGAPLVQVIQQSLFCAAGGTAEVDGSISVVPSFHFAPRWGLVPPSVTQLTFTGTVTETAQLTATASASAGCTLARTPLLPTPIQFTPLTVDIGIPVVLVPTLQFYLSADGTVEAAVTAGATQQATVTAGIDYANGAFTPKQQITNSFTDTLPSASALDATLDATVGTALALLVYGLAGPLVNVDSSMQFTVSPGQTPWCQLSAGDAAGAWLVVPLLALDFSQPSIFSRTVPLAQCSMAPPAGSITIVQQVVGPVASSAWTLTGGLGTFTLPAAGGTKVVPGLAAGSFALSETQQPGYTLGVRCSNGATGTSGVTVGLAAGQTVTCTFTATTTLPTVTGISPLNGPASGGVRVTITGTNLSGATAITFGATPAASFSVVAPTTIIAITSGEAAGTVDVRVTTPVGTSALNPPADQFTFGTGTADGGPWPTFHHDPQHTGRGLFTGPSSATLRWRYQTSGAVYSSPSIGADGTVYVGSYDSYVYALNPDGNLSWRYQTLGQVVSSPAIEADGTVYFGTLYGYVYALNADGSFKWRFTTGSFVYSSPAIGADGTIYVGSFDGYLYAINPDGTPKWRFHSGNVYSSPAIGADGTVYFGSEDTYVYALTPSGFLKWRSQTGSTIDSSPAIGTDGTVYVSSEDSYLYALNQDGTLKWHSLLIHNNVYSGVHSSPAVAVDGTIYIGSEDGYVYALNPDGSLKWNYQTGSNIDSSPAIGADGTVYVGSQDDYLYAITPDGSLKWHEQTGGGVGSSPAIGADGSVYVGSYDDYLYAFGPGSAASGPAATSRTSAGSGR